MINIVTNNNRSSITVNEIPVGQTFKGRVGIRGEELFLKGFNDLISLVDPVNLIWDAEGDLVVYDYQPVDIEVRIVTNAN